MSCPEPLQIPLTSDLSTWIWLRTPDMAQRLKEPKIDVNIEDVNMMMIYLYCSHLPFSE